MPEAFVGQILGELARAGLVEGCRGAGGGFRLAVAPEGVSVLDVVEALDGAPWAPEAPSPGPDEPPAVARVWEEARAAMEGVLSHHTIAAIASLEKARPHGDGRGAAFAGPHLSEAEDRRFGRGTGTEEDAALAGPRASAGGEGACRTTTSAGGRRSV